MQIQNISCSTYSNLLKKNYFLRILESLCFLLITLYPHEIQEISYAFGKKVFRLQYPHFLPYFSIIWASVNSFY